MRLSQSPDSIDDPATVLGFGAEPAFSDFWDIYDKFVRCSLFDGVPVGVKGIDFLPQLVVKRAWLVVVDHSKRLARFELGKLGHDFRVTFGGRDISKVDSYCHHETRTTGTRLEIVPNIFSITSHTRTERSTPTPPIKDGHGFTQKVLTDGVTGPIQ